MKRGLAATFSAPTSRTIPASDRTGRGHHRARPEHPGRQLARRLLRDLAVGKAQPAGDPDQPGGRRTAIARGLSRPAGESLLGRDLRIHPATTLPHCSNWRRPRSRRSATGCWSRKATRCSISGKPSAATPEPARRSCRAATTASRDFPISSRKSLNSPGYNRPDVCTVRRRRRLQDRNPPDRQRCVVAGRDGVREACQDQGGQRAAAIREARREHAAGYSRAAGRKCRSRIPLGVRKRWRVFFS